MTILDLAQAKQLPAFRGVAESRLGDVLDAANAWVEARIRRPIGYPAPADLVQAVALLTNRYLSRDNSPDGFVGMQETGGPVYIGKVDRDVESLIAPYRPVVFG